MNIEEAITHAREVAEGCNADNRDCAYQHDKLADWLEELKAYKATGLELKEIEELKLIRDWIYGSPGHETEEFCKIIEEVEKALGFKLFVWQKSYIQFGVFRKYGATTAEILRDILDVDGEPLDYSHCVNKFYAREMRKIKRILDDAGIQTRTVYFSENEKRDARKKN